MSIEEIWREYRTGLQAFLQSRMANAADVEDVLQEVLIKSHAGLAQLKSEKSIKAWIFQIARNAIVDHYRRSERSRRRTARSTSR